MSENITWDDDDLDMDQDADSSNDSRAMKELRKANRAKDKQIKEMSELLESLQTAQRDRSIKDVLASKGMNEKISAFIPKDITSAEEVENWVTEYGDVFGIQTESSDAGSSPAEDPNAAALNRISQAQSSGQTMSGDPDQLAALINAAANPEELNQLLYGNATGPEAF